jgi:hypothetical protein
MTDPTPANVELAIALPLGAVANQLTRIEAELRFLSMKASAYANERDSGQLAAKLSPGLEKINEVLDLIRGLVGDMDASIQPAAARLPGKSSTDRALGEAAADRDD